MLVFTIAKSSTPSLVEEAQGLNLPGMVTSNHLDIFYVCLFTPYFGLQGLPKTPNRLRAFNPLQIFGCIYIYIYLDTLGDSRYPCSYPFLRKKIFSFILSRVMTKTKNRKTQHQPEELPPPLLLALPHLGVTCLVGNGLWPQECLRGKSWHILCISFRILFWSIGPAQNTRDLMLFIPCISLDAYTCISSGGSRYPCLYPLLRKEIRKKIGTLKNNYIHIYIYIVLSRVMTITMNRKTQHEPE